MPIRVAQIMGKFSAGGVESVIVNYYRHLNHDKVQFDFYTDADSPRQFPKELLDMGARHIVLPPYQCLPKYLSELEKSLNENPCQIVHSNLNTLSVFPLFAAWRAGVPVRIAHSHSTAGGGMDFKRDMIKYALRPFSKLFATHYFACSEHAGRWLFGNRAFQDGKVQIIPNAVDTEQFVFQQTVREKIRREFKWENRYVIGHIGRFSPPKNHIGLIDIFDSVSRKREDAVLVLIGDASKESRIVKEVRAKIARVGLENRVYILEPRDDVWRFYQAFDALALPSLYEGFGMVALEAQISGLPCVVSERVPKEIALTDAVRFLPLKAGPEAWAAAFCNARGKRGDYSAALRKAGFSIREAAQELEARYIALIGKNGKSPCYENSGIIT